MRTLVLLAMLTPATAAAQIPEGWTDFDRQFREYVERDGVVGASVVFVKDGRVLARSDTGHADRAFLYLNPRTRAAVIAAFNTTNYASPTDRVARVREAAIALLR